MKFFGNVKNASVASSNHSPLASLPYFFAIAVYQTRKVWAGMAPWLGVAAARTQWPRRWMALWQTLLPYSSHAVTWIWGVTIDSTWLRRTEGFPAAGISNCFHGCVRVLGIFKSIYINIASSTATSKIWKSSRVSWRASKHSCLFWPRHREIRSWEEREIRC